MKLQWISIADYQTRLSTRAQYTLLSMFVLVTLPFFFYLDGVMVRLIFGAAVFKALSVRFAFPRPIIATAVFSVLLLSAALMFFALKRLQLNDAFLSLLVLMGSCKLLEANNQRDARILFLLLQLLIFAVLMYSQKLKLFIYLLFVFFINIFVLSAILQKHGVKEAKKNVKGFVLQLLWMLPFVTVLYVLFPRVAPFWGVMPHVQRNVTGLTDEIQLGDISSLVQSNEVVFRVRFQNGMPPTHLLYWRGPVLWVYDGTSWKQRRADASFAREEFIPVRSSMMSYQWIPVKDGIEWLTALDISNNRPNFVWAGRSMQKRFARRVRPSGDGYFLQSFSEYTLQKGELPKREQEMATFIPRDVSMPLTRQLAADLYQQAQGDVEQFVLGFYRYLQENNFDYTLAPSPNVGNVDTFLFVERAGFCEHYASALALAARSVGIPARLIAGYQGGMRNSFSSEWVVREENAHGWVELHDSARGWVRYDPTAVVAPYRIQSARLLGGDLLGGDSRSFYARMSDNFSWIATLRDFSDALSARWNDWIVQYSQEKQFSLLEGVGLNDKVRLVLVMVALALCFILLMIVRSVLLLKQPSGDKVSHAAHKALKSLQRQGMERPKAQDFAEFLRMLATHLDEKGQAQLIRCADLYEQFRYADTGDEQILIEQIAHLPSVYANHLRLNQAE